MNRMQFLTPDDLQNLTGLKRQAAIKAWLKAEGIRYIEGADGWPRVLQSVVLARLGEKAPPPQREPQLRLRHA